MGKAKTWSSEECEGAAKAYIDATLDEIRGAEQRGEEFAARVHKCFDFYSPPGVRGTGTWSDRDPTGDGQKAWWCVRDTLLKDVQRFYRTLNTVLNMGLSGLTHEEKVNIAVAMYLKKIKDGETPYQYKNFDANKWRLFKAYRVLKTTGKIAEPSIAQKPSDEVGGDAEESNTTNVEDTDGNEGFITDSSLKPTTREGKKIKGRDSAKNAETRMDHLKRKTVALEAFADTEKKKLRVMEDIKTQVQTQNIIAMLNHPSVLGNQAVSDRLVRGVLDTLGVNRRPSARTNTSAREDPTPGDLIGTEIDTENNENDEDEGSLDSSAMNRPLAGEALANHQAAMERGRTRLNNGEGFPGGYPV